MQAVHWMIQESDGLIVATPLYFAGVTAQTKAWLDRLFCVYRDGPEPETARVKEDLVHLHAEPAGCPALRDPPTAIHAYDRPDRSVREGSSYCV